MAFKKRSATKRTTKPKRRERRKQIPFGRHARTVASFLRIAGAEPNRVPRQFDVSPLDLKAVMRWQEVRSHTLSVSAWVADLAVRELERTPDPVPHRRGPREDAGLKELEL